MSRGPLLLPVVLPVRLTVEDREKLGQVAAREDRSIGYVVRRAIRREIGSPPMPEVAFSAVGGQRQKGRR